MSGGEERVPADSVIVVGERVARDWSALVPDAGTVRWGHETRPGYFAQDHKDVISDDDTHCEISFSNGKLFETTGACAGD